MSRDFDNFPVYDPIIREDIYLSASWTDFIAAFVESLQGYLSEHGMFVPRLTIAERDLIQEPQEGQMIYVDDETTPTVPHTGHLQIWQVVSGTGQWTVIV